MEQNWFLPTPDCLDGQLGSLPIHLTLKKAFIQIRGTSALYPLETIKTLYNSPLWKYQNLMIMQVHFKSDFARNNLLPEPGI